MMAEGILWQQQGYLSKDRSEEVVWLEQAGRDQLSDELS